MKVLMISGDKNLLKTGAEARERLALQQSAVERLDVFVWPQVHRYRDIARAARTQGYDVITSQDPFWRGVISWWLARRYGAKLNLQVHADLEAQSAIKKFLATFLLRRADTIRPQSNRVALQIARLGVKGKSTILPVFIDLSRVTGVARTKHPSFAKTILWIGRFEEEKDPLLAISVFKEVCTQGINAGLIMLGSGSLDATLKQAAEGLPIEFPGWQEPARYFAMADAVLSTSPFESYGASIVEALATNVPVVSLDVGVAREAGAHVAAKEDELATILLRVLQSGERGMLKLQVLDAPQWAREWRQSLI